ncbi:hypothetical protein PLESTB_000130800 [Pleodorina starrii]|uniref:Uncharacterized protein n=1 Tax=Pleodorina starrii TaxID=330485 RepID=A0A9W6BAU0_9CHLO|nr:hypothetical protein PLESTM_000490000 [Pleodorina starrii]GLC48731.1 hypothetical protein PLESTB_000130800 [Pleodorina starrii]GLC74283.1 hypothetical protein PLESTF_001484800 [Pleodorina starrii]
MSSSADAPPSQAASDLNSQAQQMAAATANPMTGSVPATASGPDSRTTGGASLELGSSAPPLMPGGPPQEEGADRRSGGTKDPYDREMAAMDEIPASERGVGGAPAPQSLLEAAEEGRRQQQEQEFRDLGGPERGRTEHGPTR